MVGKIGKIEKMGKLGKVDIESRVKGKSRRGQISLYSDHLVLHFHGTSLEKSRIWLGTFDFGP